MSTAWSAALAAQALLAWRLPPGPVRQLHAWQSASGLWLMSAWGSDAYPWLLAGWRVANTAMIVRACGRVRAGWAMGACLMLLAIAAGSAVHFHRELIQIYSIRWLLAVIGASLMISGAWPDRWLFAYAVLIYAFAAVDAWVWFTWPALYVGHQLAQAVLFAVWARWVR